MTDWDTTERSTREDTLHFADVVSDNIWLLSRVGVVLNACGRDAVQILAANGYTICDAGQFWAVGLDRSLEGVELVVKGGLTTCSPHTQEEVSARDSQSGRNSRDDVAGRPRLNHGVESGVSEAAIGACEVFGACEVGLEVGLLFGSTAREAGRVVEALLSGEGR